MMDDLQKAYAAYHRALYNAKLQNKQKQDPSLWYGIGILYERYGSHENAEEAFTSVLKMDSQFDKSNEIYFRLGIIYKQQSKFDQSLECFGYIRKSPPQPLTEADIWFQIGHVYELKKDVRCLFTTIVGFFARHFWGAFNFIYLHNWLFFFCFLNFLKKKTVPSCKAHLWKRIKA